MKPQEIHYVWNETESRVKGDRKYVRLHEEA